MIEQAGQGTAIKPTMEIRLNGLPLDIGEMSPRWPGTLRQTAKAMAAAAMEHTLEFGGSCNVAIEVWSDDGTLLVTVMADIEAVWPGSPEC